MHYFPFRNSFKLSWSPTNIIVKVSLENSKRSLHLISILISQKFFPNFFNPSPLGILPISMASSKASIALIVLSCILRGNFLKDLSKEVRKFIFMGYSLVHGDVLLPLLNSRNLCIPLCGFVL